MPVNLMAVAVVVLLGFGHPAFWLLGLGAETAFLWAMVGSRRFRRLVDAQEAWNDQESKDAARQDLIHQLTLPNQERHALLTSKLDKVSGYYGTFAQGDPVAEDNLANLRVLETVFLKLLIARQHLTAPDSEAQAAALTTRIAELEADIADDPPETSESIRESKAATLELLRKRLALFGKRTQSLEEIDSDLGRIEAQFDLAADSAAIRAKPVEAKLDLDLASRMMTTTDYLDLGGGLESSSNGYAAPLEKELES